MFILMIYLLFFEVVFREGVNKSLLLRRQFPGSRNRGHSFLFRFSWCVM